MILSVRRIADVVMHGDSTPALLTWQTMPLDEKATEAWILLLSVVESNLMEAAQSL